MKNGVTQGGWRDGGACGGVCAASAEQCVCGRHGRVRARGSVVLCAGQCGAVCGRELLYGRRDLWALVLGLEKL